MTNLIRRITKVSQSLRYFAQATHHHRLEVKKVNLEFTVCLERLLFYPGNDEQDLNLFVRERVKAEFPMVATHPTVANTSERQLLHPDNSD